MPIQKVSTTSSSLKKGRVNALTLTSEQKAKLYTLIEAFLLFNPRPTDEQVHLLAKSVGMDHEELERVLYEFFAEVLETEVAESEDVVDHTDVPGAPGPTPEVFGYQDPLIITNADFDESINLRAGDDLGDAASIDGAPDMEQLGEPDPLKEASEHDGAPDVEQMRQILNKE